MHTGSFLWVKLNGVQNLWLQDSGCNFNIISLNHLATLQKDLPTIQLSPSHLSLHTATKPIYFVGFFNAELTTTDSSSIFTQIFVTATPLPTPILGLLSMSALT